MNTAPARRSASRRNSSANCPSHGCPSPGTPRNSVSLLICSTATISAGPSSGRASRTETSLAMAVVPVAPAYPYPLAAADARAPAGRRRHENNFDALRLVAALSVVFSHAFLIAEGSEASEPFVRLTGNQCVLGLVGVFVFFIISGYLVTGSFLRHPEPGRFALKRGLRIFPGLAVNLLVCALVLGALVTTLPLGDYL